MIEQLPDLTWFRHRLACGTGPEADDAAPILHWLETARARVKFSAELIPLDAVRGWQREEGTGDIYHHTGSFFSIHGVRTQAQGLREVNEWDQPIYGQKEGGVLALIAAGDGDAVRFLLNAKAEPGNLGTLQLAPTIQCTWSNLKRAHQGKLPPMAEYVLDEGRCRLVYAAQHDEEGGRFWRKSNSNRIYFVERAADVAFDPNGFVWATLGQIKNLALVDNVLSPFVKTIVAPL